MRRLLIIEGVTGTGKSRTIAMLADWARRVGHPVHVIDEDLTMGSFLEDVRVPSWRERPAFPGLDAGFAAVERLRREDERALVVLERFHLTVYALFSHWRLVRQYDRALHALGAAQVLLDYRPALTEQRSVLCPDRSGWADEMDEYYGGRLLAIAAVRQSQANRRRALLMSELPYLHLDNSGGNWDDCAAAILAYCGYSFHLPGSGA
jgi:hypothetical protein